MIVAVASFLVLIALSQTGFKPVKWLIYGVLQVTVGAIILFFVNAVGQAFQLEIPINPITATVAGFLGIPGVCTLILIKLFIV